ncbi:protein-L-isoaspartate O-methyltransferase family protein [Sphingorhabdus profundilacus]|nr:protein-L-isoaspartate O-methyltransferase [Sphingorhabdus profundilacus]
MPHGAESNGKILMESVSFEDMRRAMVDSQLRTNGVTQAWVLAAMGSVPREDYVPVSHHNVCYTDRAIPLDDGTVLNPPLATALLLQAADIQATDKVLLIGASEAGAQGYVAALLRARVAGLTSASTANWADAGHAAPYDVIFIDGAAHLVPDALLALAEEGARLVTGIADGPVTRLAKGYIHQGQVALKAFIDSEIAPLAAFARKPEFTF